MKTEDINRIVKPYLIIEEKREACGIVLEKDGRYRTVEVRNMHETPETHFRIAQGDIDVAMYDGEMVVAYIHTHWKPGTQEPSYEDVKNLPAGLLGIVVHPRSKSWVLYNNTVGVLAFSEGVSA